MPTTEIQKNTLIPTLTYCSNIHPLRSWRDVIDCLKGVTSEISQKFSGSEKFPLGLWFPESALDESLSERGLDELRAVMQDKNFSLATLNAFPMGVFHGQPVKTKVYLPDWSESSRLNYTLRICELAEKLGAKRIPISTLSGGYMPKDDGEKIDAYLGHFCDFARWADSRYRENGFYAELALEPEPFNTLQGEEDILLFWDDLLTMAQSKGLSEDIIYRHLGICFDTCHFAVRYKDLWSSWQSIKKRGIRIPKAQVSLAPRWIEELGEESLNRLWGMGEPVYLHQCFGRDSSGGIHAFADIPAAKSQAPPCVEWRTHFHIPIIWNDQAWTTGESLKTFMEKVSRSGGLENTVFETETYSFTNIGDEFKSESLSLEESIVQELKCLKGWLSA